MTPAAARLLLGVRPGVTPTLERHLSTHGELPATGGRRGRPDARLIEEVRRAGLIGHGGAGFPAAIKLEAVAASRGRRIVVANAVESEPTSVKDRVLLESAPHLVIDGITAACAALGASEAVLCVGSSSAEGRLSVEQALAERAGAPQPRCGIRVVELPGSYIGGQESALVNALGGGPAVPTFPPRRIHQRGLGGRPTLVQNVETLAHLALIARHGAEWFRERGTAAHPGTSLVTVWGARGWPVVHEIEHGTALTALIEAAGSAAATVRAVLVGGYAGTWIDGGLSARIRLSNDALAPHGASLGVGSVVPLLAGSCAVSEVTRVTRWLADQSAGQCGPCVHGLDALAAALEEVVRGSSRSRARIAELHPLLRRRGACAHPDGTSHFVESAIEVFAEEFSDHSRHGMCAGCGAAGTLPLPAEAPPLPPTSPKRLLGTAA
jgi:NADH:ubiquinone oxidoreductase subunit F (NADH-binding)